MISFFIFSCFSILLGLIFPIVFCKEIRDICDELKVCYDGLGCFPNDKDFTNLERPVLLLPQNPEILRTQFLLFTRTNPYNASYLSYDNIDSIRFSPFSKTSKPTKFIIHGFNKFVTEDWIRDITKEFLKKDEMNVIAVDWSVGAKLPYSQACQNARVVGAQISRLMDALSVEKGLKPEDIHIVGHSLGAHLAGYINVTNLGRITGLDPAGPYFEKAHPRVRLDPTDAQFVDVIHTDGSSVLKIGLGTLVPMGHVDFYPNGGKDQPGCHNKLSDKIHNGLMKAVLGDPEGFEYAFGCNHLLAINYFNQSINGECPYMAFPCSNYSDFEAGKCQRCTLEKPCSEMGMNAINELRNGKMFLKTLSTAPHCGYHLFTTIHFEGGQRATIGNIKAKINKSNLWIPLTHKKTKFTKNADINFVTLVPGTLGELTDINEVTLKFQYDGTTFANLIGLYSSVAKVENLTFFIGKIQKRVEICPDSWLFDEGVEKTFKKC